MASVLAAPPYTSAPAVVGSTADADWRQNGGDEAHSGHQALTGPLTPAAARRLRLAWTAPATRENEQVGGAIVVDGTVFRASGGPSGQIRRYDAVTGDDLGPLVDEPGQAFTQLAAAGDTLVVESIERPSLRRSLWAYTIRGAHRWTTPLPDAVSGGFTTSGDLILRSAGPTLFAYRVSDGTLAWQAPLAGEPGLHPPIRAGALVLQATEPGHLLAFDAKTGTLTWQREASGAELVATPPSTSVYLTPSATDASSATAFLAPSRNATAAPSTSVFPASSATATAAPSTSVFPAPPANPNAASSASAYLAPSADVDANPAPATGPAATNATPVSRNDPDLNAAGHPATTGTSAATTVRSANAYGTPATAGANTVAGNANAVGAPAAGAGNLVADANDATAAGTVFSVGERGVCAYAIADGAQLWCDAETLESPVHAGIGDGQLYVIDGHGGLAAFDAGTGARRWRTAYGLDAEVDASYWAPVNGGGAVYAVVYHFAVRGGVSTHRVELIVADARTGELVRRLDLDVDAMHGDEPLLLAGDHVYFAAVQRLIAVGAGPINP
ncbi:PQQ-binding-like beta-propeller repeat protein [Dactylosporangium sp. CA-233914]|uniref:outer membrane protein assembly factor BamB family protein n=1 Tax=Dactylosporangium sp. CA-233914 TaxID=3239934 RepID=UPI003D8CBF34